MSPCFILFVINHSIHSVVEKTRVTRDLHADTGRKTSWEKHLSSINIIDYYHSEGTLKRY